MRRPASIFDAGFRAKVLVPVIAIMVVLLAVSMWLVNRRITGQLQAGAAQQLVTFEAALKIMQQTRADDLFLRYSNAKNEPRFKAAATGLLDPEQKALLTSEGQNTFRGLLDEMIQEGVADVIMLTPGPGNGRPLVSARDPQFSTEEFKAGCASSVQEAWQGDFKLDTVQNNDRLLDIVSIPLSVGGAIVGTITFGVKNSMAGEFARLTQSELVLLSDGHVVASTLRNGDPAALLTEQFTRMTLLKRDKIGATTQEIVLGDEHYLCLAGWLSARNDPHRLGYLVLSSYEKPLTILRSTQQMILLVSLVAIVFGAAIVWWLVNKVTRPLRELRDSVEAVGRGDLTQRVPVRGRDECGELAIVFNQMMGNLQQSRAQLEKTVETLKNTQEQLVQSEKLSAVGEFVAGVAHELNNPLSAVMGFSEMLRDVSVDAKYVRYMDMIYKSAQRCQKIVQSLLSFARRHQPERKPLCVKQLVEAVLEIVHYPLRTSNIEVVTQLVPHLPVVLADEHQLQQVLLNVVNNARQAIEAHQPSGRITITTETARPNVRITIQDNGPGIPDENLRRIFDPFFTTKEVGKGTGLGLSLCYGIIKEHGGTITPVNRRGEGATFVIELPITHPAGDRPEPLPAADAEDRGDPHEGEGKRVLVIDDEEILLHMMRDELSQYGYGVDVATDGETALRQLDQDNYDAVFCDWKMPGLNGRQVYERLRATNPALCQRVHFVTGDVINESMRKFLEQEKRPCLTKPFTLAEIHAAIKSTVAKA